MLRIKKLFMPDHWRFETEIARILMDRARSVDELQRLTGNPAVTIGSLISLWEKQGSVVRLPMPRAADWKTAARFTLTENGWRSLTRRYQLSDGKPK